MSIPDTDNTKLILKYTIQPIKRRLQNQHETNDQVKSSRLAKVKES